jgi:hypothetical protein
VCGQIKKKHPGISSSTSKMKEKEGREGGERERERGEREGRRREGRKKGVERGEVGERKKISP